MVYICPFLLLPIRDIPLFYLFIFLHTEAPESYGPGASFIRLERGIPVRKMLNPAGIPVLNVPDSSEIPVFKALNSTQIPIGKK